MGELRVISAGAGTGKTHRLANELVEALVDDSGGRVPIAPEGVVAVTYTRSAAAELEARVRTALIERGHADLAVTPEGDTVYVIKGFVSMQEKALAEALVS